MSKILQKYQEMTLKKMKGENFTEEEKAFLSYAETMMLNKEVSPTDKEENIEKMWKALKLK
jgi:hypothetical protein